MSKADAFRKYEGMTISFEQALVMTREEMGNLEESEGFNSLVQAIGKEKATEYLKRIEEDNARRICLVSIYGADRFIEVAERVAKSLDDNPANWLGSMEIVEKELAK